MLSLRYRTPPYGFISGEAIPIRSDMIGTGRINDPVIMLNTYIVGYYMTSLSGHEQPLHIPFPYDIGRHMAMLRRHIAISYF